MSKLAINGGEMACQEPLPAWPHYDHDEIDAVTAVLRSGKVNQWTDDHVKRFEEACANAFGQPYAIAVFNGTLALELALYAAGVGPGDEVIVTPRSFIASASCVISLGATPVFADVDLETQNISPETIKAVLSPKTKAIIPVHLNGWPADMPGIMELAEEHNLFVIEDCAQSHGAMIDGKPAGSFGHAAALSFCQDKIISTGGEGGMVLLKDERQWKRAWSYKDHGKSYDSVFHKKHPDGFRWLHDSFGTNWRLTSIQAVIGLKQLEKLHAWIKRRQEIAFQLRECVSPYSAVSTPFPAENVTHACYRFCFYIDDSKLAEGWDRAKVMAAINAEGIRCLEVCPEIYREKAFDELHYPTPNTPNTILVAQQCLMLIVHPMLDQANVDVMCTVLRKVFEEAAV